MELYFYAPTCCTLDYNLQPTIPTIRKSGFTPIYAKHCISPHFRAIPQDRSQAPAKVCSLCFAAHLHSLDNGKTMPFAPKKSCYNCPKARRNRYWPAPLYIFTWKNYCNTTLRLSVKLICSFFTYFILIYCIAQKPAI